ncbi:MAG: type II toxin-antitoxin system HicA family toxin [Candidatus Bathyarchaeia archaeon]|jgi:predicted RNA binding protein YcfA (HicA-like mRNA interferase family)
MVVKALGRAGFAVVGRRGSHIRLKRVTGQTRIVIVPDHKELAQGTLLSIIRQAGFTREDFLALLKK